MTLCDYLKFGLAVAICSSACTPTPKDVSDIPIVINFESFVLADDTMREFAQTHSLSFDDLQGRHLILAGYLDLRTENSPILVETREDYFGSSYRKTISLYYDEGSIDPDCGGAYVTVISSRPFDSFIPSLKSPKLYRHPIIPKAFEAWEIANSDYDEDFSQDRERFRCDQVE